MRHFPAVGARPSRLPASPLCNVSECVWIPVCSEPGSNRALPAEAGWDLSGISDVVEQAQVWEIKNLRSQQCD